MPKENNKVFVSIAFEEGSELYKAFEKDRGLTGRATYIRDQIMRDYYNLSNK